MSDRLRFVYWPPNTKLESRQHFEGPANEADASPSTAADLQTTPDEETGSAGRDTAGSPVEAPSDPDDDVPADARADGSEQTSEQPEADGQRPSENALANDQASRARQKPSAEQQSELGASISLDAIARFDPVSQRYSFEPAPAQPDALRAEITSASLAADESLDLPTVTAATNASAWPFNSVALILTEFESFPGVFFIGSGVAIGPNTIITASHNVWQSNTLDEVDHIYVYTGFTGTFPQPGTGGPTVNDTGWTVDYNEVGELFGDGITPSDSAIDYAVINVNHTFDSWFGISTEFGLGPTQGGVINMTGYPFTQGGTQDNEIGSVSYNSFFETWEYGTLSPEPGNSGGPLWYDADPGAGVDPMLVGIVSSSAHSAKIGSSPVDEINNWLQSRGLDPVTGVSSNNGAAGGTGGIGGAPDLITRTNVLGQDFAAPGNFSGSLEFDVENAGSGPGNTSSFEVYLSTDSTVTTDDTLIGNAAESVFLGTDRSHTISANFEITDTLQPGQYHIGVVPTGPTSFTEVDRFSNRSRSDSFIVTPFTQANDTLTLPSTGGEWYALSGDDNITTSSAGDTVFGGGGNDTLTGAEGADVLRGGGGADTIFGGDGDDTLKGGDENDVLNGGAGNDLLLTGGGPGNDVYDGGAGTDTLELEIGGSVNLATGIATGPGADIHTVLNVENVIGGARSETIVGDGSANVLKGEFGDDTVRGDAGADILDGGFGNDRLFGDAGNDTVNGDQGADVLWGAGGNDTMNGGDGDDTLRGNAGFDNLEGGDGDDILFGDFNADILRGGDDDDTLNGGAGGDRLFGDAGNDIINGDDGNDSLVGSLGNDTLDGGAGNDTMRGNAGFDVLSGGTGDDRMFGDFNADNLFGGDGNDVLNGGFGFDRLFGDNGDDTLNGDQGPDSLWGGTGDDTLNGGADNDTLRGNAGFDTLNGGAGDDTLSGDFNRDTLNGGEGSDQLFGGAGGDTFVFTDSAGSDTINDWEDDTDMLDFSGVTSVTTIADLTIDAVSATQTDISYDDGTGTVTLTILSSSPFSIDQSDTIL